jgi:hypothetical protein
VGSIDKPPTEKQLEFARSLGVNLPENATRRQVSRMIDEALDNAPASEGQKQFLRNLGVDVPPGITRNQMSLLLDTALDLKYKVQQQSHREWTENEISKLISRAAFEQLLEELISRDKPFSVVPNSG